MGYFNTYEPELRLDRAPAGIQRAALLIDAVTDAPDQIFKDPVVYMGLRNVHGRLRYAHSKDALGGIPEDLWKIALRAEFGVLGTALEEMREAEAALREGMARRADRPHYDEGLYFEMGLSPLFHNPSGRHDMAELKEGTKDGKTFYKKMIPGAVRLFMPDTKYLAVRYNDFRTSGAQIFAQVGETEVPLEAELYKDMHVIAYDDLKDMGASAMIVRGGEYQLQPTVSVKTMRRFGWGQEDEDNQSNKEEDKK
jgi:hypothetical protein